MAKRFGRNQKRQMRAQIALLETKSSDRDAIVRRLLNTEDRLIDWAKSMNSYLGSEHPLNERVKKIVLERVPYINERYNFMEKRPFKVVVSESLNDYATSCQYISAVLHVINIYRDDVPNSVRIELLSPDQRSYFAISEEHLLNGRGDPKFVNWMANEVAQRLSEHLGAR